MSERSRSSYIKLKKEKELELRKHCFPSISDEQLWNRNKDKGFATIPKVMPHIMLILDEISSQGPLARTYFALWCRTMDAPFLTIEKEKAFAFESGFTKAKAVYSWKVRMKELERLGFIKSKNGPDGEFNFVLIMNPYLVVSNLRKEGNNSSPPIHLNEDQYTALFMRSQEIGSKHLTEN